MLKKAERCGMWCCWSPTCAVFRCMFLDEQDMVALIHSHTVILNFYFFLDGQPIMEIIVSG